MISINGNNYSPMTSKELFTIKHRYLFISYLFVLLSIIFSVAYYFANKYSHIYENALFYIMVCFFVVDIFLIPLILDDWFRSRRYIDKPLLPRHCTFLYNLSTKYSDVQNYVALVHLLNRPITYYDLWECNKIIDDIRSINELNEGQANCIKLYSLETAK